MLTVINVRVEDRQIIGSFTDPTYVLIYAAAGSSLYRLQEREYDFAAGCAILMPPYVPHVLRVEPGQSIRHHVVHFKADTEWEFLDKLPSIIALPEGRRQAMADLLDGMLEEWERRGGGWKLIVQGRLTDALGRYVRHSGGVLQGEPISSKGWHNVRHALDVMQQQFDQPLTIDELSREAGLSNAYFSRLFKAHTGVSPLRYLNLLRVGRAKELLLEGQLNCTEIAPRCGFDSVHAFSKVFKKHEGVSPAKWGRASRPVFLCRGD